MRAGVGHDDSVDKLLGLWARRQRSECHAAYTPAGSVNRFVAVRDGPGVRRLVPVNRLMYPIR